MRIVISARDGMYKVCRNGRLALTVEREPCGALSVGWWLATHGIGSWSFDPSLDVTEQDEITESYLSTSSAIADS